MTRPLPVLILLLALSLPFLADAQEIKVPTRSVSASGQFIIYCEDQAVRMKVTTFVEETKAAVLRALGQRDDWKRPVILRFFPVNATRPGQAPMQFEVFGSKQGIKVQINVLLGGPLPATSLQSEVIRAVLLECAYRDRYLLMAGQRYNEPPTWLVEGIAYAIRQDSLGVNADIYKTLIDVNKLPSIREFLRTQQPAGDAASMMLYRAYSYSLLRILQELPRGKSCLSAFVAGIPVRNEDPATDLAGYFPALKGSEVSLEKWWTLSMARLSTLDDYEGLSPEATEAQLVTLLTVTVPGEEGEEPEEFQLDEFQKFLKRYGARAMLKDRQQDFLRLETKASPLYRGIVSDYQEIAYQLARGKTRGVSKRLQELADYRGQVQKRVNDIADYLNWMEATQLGVKSHTFDLVVQTAEEPMSVTPRNDPVSLYLNEIEKQLTISR